MTTPPELSVIVCAYSEQRWDDLVAAIDSLRRQTIPPGEIIVIIDHNPALLARARASFPDVVVLENSQRRGLSGARNSGVAAARGAIIAFLDDDAEAAPNWIAQLLAGYSDPRVVGVGGAIEPLWQQPRPGWFPAEFDWVIGCTYRGTPASAAPVRNLIGANMSFRREVFVAAGHFRSEIGRVGTHPVGCEETELCIRIRQHWPEYTLLYRPEARVFHRVPPPRGRWSYFRARCYGEGISKALVRRFVGARDGLSSERSYTLRTLPSGVARGLADSARGDPHGLLRAGAIVAGLVMTVVGFVRGSVAPVSG
ncbi:MAG: glycosyltransferase family 2 protein [Roseiflexaceae bacterium]